MARDRFDGDDVLEVRERIGEAVERARADAAMPTLVEVLTYRFRGHSMSDPGKYRTKDEIEEWKKRDPLAVGARAPARGARRRARTSSSRSRQTVKAEIAGRGAFAEESARAGRRAIWPSSRTTESMRPRQM